MVTYGSQKGYFDLDNSNNCVGSYFKIEHIREIFGINDSVDLNFVQTERKYNTNNLIGESDLRKLIKTNLITYFPKNNIVCNNHPKSKKVEASFDEYVIKALIKRVLPEATIIHQYYDSKAAKMIDLFVTKDDLKLYIEFDGPSHFLNKDKIDPIVEKKHIENSSGIRCVRWPFWIQRCTQNVESLINDNVKGFGALWSTNYLFGDFAYDNSAVIIDELTQQFKAVDNSYEYFYFNDSKNRNNPTVKNPTHVIVNQIKNDLNKMKRIIPKGTDNEDKWKITVANT